MPSVFLSELLLVIVAAFVGGFVARSVKLPPVLGYIVSGIVFGMLGKNFFISYESLVSISEMGVALLLFTLGFEISLDQLKKINKKVFLVGILNVVLVAFALIPLLLFLGLGTSVSILLSILFSFSSTAVIVKILEEKGQLANFPGNNVLIYLLIQDLFIIPVIFLLPVLFSENNFNSFSLVEFVVSAAKPILLFTLILVGCRVLLPKLLNFLFRYPSHELTILASIFTAALAIFVLMWVGLPTSIAAFLAGILISEQGKNLAPLAEIRPFRDLFLVLFFVMTGMLVNFNFLVSNFPFLLGLVFLIIVIKFAVVYFLLRMSKHSPSASVFISSHIANIGEFAAVIAQIAFVSLYITGNEYNLVLSVFILSLLIIPFWLKYARSGFEHIARLGILGKVTQEEHVSFETAAYKDHVIICGHGRVGKQTRAMLELANVPYVVIDFNKGVINKLLEASKYAIYGDPSDEDILKAAFVESAKILVIAVPDTFSQKRIISLALKLNPKIAILTRSHVEEDRFDLINMGVNTIVMPEFEAGVRIGIEVLDRLNVDPEQISSHAKRIRKEHIE